MTDLLNQQPYPNASNHQEEPLYRVIAEMISALKSIYLNYPKQLDDDEELDEAIQGWCIVFRDVDLPIVARILGKLTSDPSLGKDAAFFPNPLILKQRYCTPEYADYDWPSLNQAYTQATLAQGQRSTFQYSHPAIPAAVNDTTTWVLDNEPEAKSLAKFSRAYQRLFEIYIREGELPNQRAIEGTSAAEQAEAQANKLLHQQMRDAGIDPAGGRHEFDRLMKEFGHQGSSENLTPTIINSLAKTVKPMTEKPMSREEENLRRNLLAEQAQSLIDKSKV